MNDPLGLRTALTEVFTNLTSFVAEFVPRLVTGVVVFILGWIIASIVQRVLRTTFVRLRIDTLLEKIGITSMFTSLGMKGSLSESAAKLVYYLILVLFLQSAANAVGLVSIANAITAFFSYLPSLVAALLVLLFGNVVAQFAGSTVARSAEESGVDYAPMLGRAVTGAILFIAAIMAISQLGIDTQMIRTVVVIGLAGTAAGIALSFGIGSRETTRNLMAGFYARKSFRVGDPIEIGDVRGTLAGITATRTLIEVDGRTVTVPNARIAKETVTNG